MKGAISINNLHKSYTSKHVLKNVSLDVGAGEIFGFLGPNGAGKTTTIRCLMDFIRPSAGSVSIFGKDSQSESVEVKRMVGYLSADNQLYAKWTAAEHIEFFGRMKGHTQGSAALLKRLDLNPRVQARHLSTGNRQKLGLILALAGSPRLLVLDEPTSGLDPLLQHEIYIILWDYVKSGGTVFLSSHNLPEVEHICTNVGVIRDGQIVANKSMDDIRQMKIHIVTASFVRPLPHDVFNLPGVDVLTLGDNSVVLRVKGDLNHLLSMLATHKLSDLEIAHAPLEDIFMEYYRSQS